MNFELVISLVALCYAATALIYNVREFRKVGGEFRKIGRHMDELSEDHRRFHKEMAAEHRRFRKEMAAEHREIMTALRSLSAQISKSGRKGLVKAQ